jgi:hypothetical protein
MSGSCAPNSDCKGVCDGERSKRQKFKRAAPRAPPVGTIARRLIEPIPIVGAAFAVGMAGYERKPRLNLLRCTKRRITRERIRLAIKAEANASWSLDFMHDAPYSGKRFRMLNVFGEGVFAC